MYFWSGVESDLTSKMKKPCVLRPGKVFAKGIRDGRVAFLGTFDNWRTENEQEQEEESRSIRQTHNAAFPALLIKRLGHFFGQSASRSLYKVNCVIN